jgi:hypothetical protein
VQSIELALGHRFELDATNALLCTRAAAANAEDLGSTGIGNSAFAQTAFDLRITGPFTLSARGTDTNRVDGNIVCNGGEPAGGLKTGTPNDWDGLDDDVDGTIGGNYLGC